MIRNIVSFRVGKLRGVVGIGTVQMTGAGQHAKIWTRLQTCVLTFIWRVRKIPKSDC
jgi:hypothetical protein